MAGTTPSPIVELAAIGERDAARVGNKALRLAALLRAGFPVPAGFCLTTVGTAGWNAAVRDAVLAAYRRLGGPVSVRSSAVEEDACGASYAGIYHSELPVHGEDELLAAVERCVASWHAPAASAYRRLQGDQQAPLMALIVQRLVPASAAGVAYTRDPLDPRRREVHLNSVFGLGEPLAAGRVDGDTMALSRRGRLLRQHTARKRVELTARGPCAVAAERADMPSLSLAQARRVMLLALAAERHFGRPQDVEFAFEGERLWILQSRPLASCAAEAEIDRFLAETRRRVARRRALLRDRGVLRGHDMVLSNGNVGELLPTPTAMSFGLFRQIFAGRYGAIAQGRRRLGYLFDPSLAEHLYEWVGGQAYFNLEIDAATFDFGAAPLVDDYLRRVAEDPALANYPELQLYEQHLADAGGHDPAAACRRRFHDGMLRAAGDWLARFADGTPATLAAPPAQRWETLAASDCAARIGALIRRLRSGPCVDFVEVARLGFYFAARVRTRLVGWLGGEGEAHCARLLSGLPGSMVTRQALDLEALARGRLGRDAFLVRYGHTAANELELSEPRLAEQPERLDAMLADLAHSGRRPAREFARLQRERLAGEETVRSRLAETGVDAEAIAVFAAELRLAQALLPLRETVKHHYTEVHAEIRRGLLALADRLGWPAERIFDLQPRELPAAVRAPARLRAIAERRAVERRIARQLASEGRLPAVIFASRAEAIGALPEPAGADGCQGQALSPGRRRGIARVVGPDGRLPPLDGSGREILVLRAANLGIAPVLRTVAGLVVEVGGLLAHGACQAREAGIPAIALADATRRIGDGCEILIDGSTGRLSVLTGAREAADEPTHAAL